MNLSSIYREFDESVFAEIKLYNEKQESDDKKIVFPMLLNDINRYVSADLKVMVFGQEVNKWCYPEALGNFYEDCENHEQYMEFYKGYMEEFIQSDKFNHNTLFWKEYFRLNETLVRIYPKKKIGFMWNNLIKLTCLEMNSGKKMFNKIPAIKSASLLIKDEIEYFRPNIIIFLTGPSYDFIALNKEYIEIESIEKVPSYSENELVVINIPNVDLALRTYHPGYLNRNQILKNKLFTTLDELFLSI